MVMRRQSQSSVKIRVRETSLTLGEFTVDQMVRATGFKPTSVRTELRRMREEKFLTTASVKGTRVGPGAPRALYKVTSSHEKVQKLARQVQSFYHRPTVHGHPSTRFYDRARRLLDKVEIGKYQGGEQRATMLRQAEEALAMAWHDEEHVKGATEAFLECERARLECLKGDLDGAAHIFHKVKSSFESLHLPDEAARVKEYVWCVEIKRRLRQSSEAGPEEEARLVLEALKSAEGTDDRPLVRFIKEVLRKQTDPTLTRLLEKAQSPEVKTPDATRRVGGAMARKGGNAFGVSSLGWKLPMFADADKVVPATVRHIGAAEAQDINVNQNEVGAYLGLSLRLNQALSLSPSAIKKKQYEQYLKGLSS
jgi:hypothetical protein